MAIRVSKGDAPAPTPAKHHPPHAGQSGYGADAGREELAVFGKGASVQNFQGIRKLATRSKIVEEEEMWQALASDCLFFLTGELSPEQSNPGKHDGRNSTPVAAHIIAPPPSAKSFSAEKLWYVWAGKELRAQSELIADPGAGALGGLSRNTFMATTDLRRKIALATRPEINSVEVMKTIILGDYGHGSVGSIWGLFPSEEEREEKQEVEEKEKVERRRKWRSRKRTRIRKRSPKL
ncbi:hypothetical protein B0T24DRAFT_667780 [Lasiosphaeria ovina]|uniref:Uncharacterized protein n=1 Tax=Lasiosphaeria ovina TaxID=92902 RepID=A0AAE0K7K8_9PEZI|nr:hypothetical protein B0T24DRAFT_667780 [Lasiosphaeria ovina]